MSTTHGQPGLSSDQRSTIRSTILSTRHTLEDELRRQLEKYGIYEDKRLSLEELSHLTEEERHTRRTLDAAIERELESTEGDLERSITNYVREATKTYLNRFVALKTIEVRGLVEETITERPEYGNRSYMHHTVAEIAGELTNAPDDGFGAALDLAYQEIGAEIRMIFEESEHTAIDLDAQVREEVIDELDEIDDEAWESDEALGWVYQYFGEEERKEIDERVDEENYKIAGTDIATKTQLFTPRYIVEWMVDNSLGRTWLEMQGERTNIDDEENCFYLTPLEDSLIDRETKAVEDITVLDPACGSGHMLFYAFDVLYQMYLEEGEIPEEYIPREILRNNLYGIDIDSGAVQIAALSLFLKAKEKSPSVSIPQLNIVSADTVLINGDRKQEVLDGARSELEEEILEEIWTSFDNIRERGSLVRIEEKIDEKLEEYRETFESKGQAQFTKEGVLSTQSTFVSDGREVTWENLKEQILENIQILTESALEKNDPIEEMFTGEVERSVRLLDLFLHDYDIVLSNPPYLGSAKMNDSLKGFVKEEYKGSSDLYTAFIERNLDFTSSNGYLSMITMETFMYQYSYRGMRSKILNEMNFVDAMHLENREEGYMNICFLTKRLDEENRVPSRFNRLISTDDKEGGMEEITRAERDGESDDRVFVVNQKSFEEIDRSPFVYWFGDDVLQLFTEHPSLNSLLEIKQGLCTGDDDRFIRSWWEVSREKIGKKYSWIVMGGDDSKYYYSPEKVVEWGDSQVNIKETKGSRLQNTKYYKKEGINYRDFSKYFTPRLHQKTDIFNQTTRFIPTQKSKNRMLGYLSSSLVRFIMDGLGSGLHYTVGDGKRIPVKKPTFDDTVVSELVGQAVNIRKRSDSLYETSREFSPNNLVSQWRKLLASIDINKADVEIIHGLVDRRTFDEYSISEESRTRIYDDLPANLSEYPHIINSGTLETDEFKFRTQIDTIEVSREEYTAIVEQVKENKSKSIRELAEVLEVSPYTIAFIRENTGAYSLSRKQEAAGRFLSYCIGLLMGRWEYKSYSSNNSILSLDEMMNKLDDYLSVFDDKDVARHRIESMLGQGIENWLRSEYFSEHHVSEYKRRGQRTPIYWQLNSPNDSFSCFIYYHRIDRNTLPKLRGQYLDSRIGKLEKELETLNTQINADNPDNKLLNRKEQVQNDLNDIREFRDTIDEMIDDGVTVDVEKGIWENIKEWDQYEVLETGLPKLKSSYSR